MALGIFYPKHALEITDEIDLGYFRAPKEYPNYSERSPENIEIDSLVLHYTEANYHLSFELLALDLGVSAHYLVREDGRIDSLVSEDKKAWHGGVSSWRG